MLFDESAIKVLVSHEPGESKDRFGSVKQDKKGKKYSSHSHHLDQSEDDSSQSRSHDEGEVISSGNVGSGSDIDSSAERGSKSAVSTKLGNLQVVDGFDEEEEHEIGPMLVPSINEVDAFLNLNLDHSVDHTETHCHADHHCFSTNINSPTTTKINFLTTSSKNMTRSMM